jgi:hypothetical protein
LLPRLQLTVYKKKETVNNQGGYGCKYDFRNHDFNKVMAEIQPVSDQETEYINIHIVCQIIDDAQHKRQCNIVLIIVLCADSVQVSHIDVKQGIKAKRTAVKKIHEKPGYQAVKHAGLLALNEPAYKYGNEKKVRRRRQKGDLRKHTYLDRKCQDQKYNINQYFAHLLLPRFSAG